MAKGIIYLMTTAVPGLVKIGKTGSGNFESRMYNLEHDGYRNVTALKREFAIEVEDYDEKETLLHTIFEKSRVSDTELFALDVSVAIQLLSSFEGTVVYPKTETKEEIFDEAAETSKGRLIPDGKYFLKRYKQSEGKTIDATAWIEKGNWTILKGSVIAGDCNVKGSVKARSVRSSAQVDSTGKLLDDLELGECSPSYAGVVVIGIANDGWKEWKNGKGEPIDIYRVQSSEE